MNRHLLLSLITSFALASSALASPGAHGPNGEHLDQPGSGTVSKSSFPVLEAHTEAFEIVATLMGDELSVTVERYETNEPVLTGKLDIEFGDIKAGSKLHTDFGDFSFTDEKLIKALQQPGQHALLFTFQVGEENDLIEGVLVVSEDAHGHGPSIVTWLLLLAAIIAAIAIVYVGLRYRRRQSQQELRS
jgi:hypothetical protein